MGRKPKKIRMKRPGMNVAANFMRRDKEANDSIRLLYFVRDSLEEDILRITRGAMSQIENTVTRYRQIANIPLIVLSGGSVLDATLSEKERKAQVTRARDEMGKILKDIEEQREAERKRREEAVKKQREAAAEKLKDAGPETEPETVTVKKTSAVGNSVESTRKLLEDLKEQLPRDPKVEQMAKNVERRVRSRKLDAADKPGAQP